MYHLKWMLLNWMEYFIMQTLQYGSIECFPKICWTCLKQFKASEATKFRKNSQSEELRMTVWASEVSEKQWRWFSLFDLGCDWSDARWWLVDAWLCWWLPVWPECDRVVVVVSPGPRCMLGLLVASSQPAFSKDNKRLECKWSSHGQTKPFRILWAEISTAVIL